MSSSPPTPYWGELPPPKAVGPASRSTSQDYGRYSEALSPFFLESGPSHGNRASVQTARSAHTAALTESTLSPIASPARSSIVGAGLAPRPPSLTHTANAPSSPLAKKKSARHGGRDHEDRRESLDATMVPLPQSNLPYEHYARGFSGDWSPPFVTNASDPTTTRPPRRSTIAHGSRTDHAVVGAGDVHPAVNPHVSGGGDIHSPSSGGKRPPVPGSTLAVGHSPLKRLEMTLDTITKEEKRARVAAAEQRVKQRNQSLSQHVQTPGQPHPSEQRGAVASGSPAPVHFSSPEPSSPTQPSYANARQGYSGRQTATTSSTGGITRNLSFKQRAALNNKKLPDTEQAPILVNTTTFATSVEEPRTPQLRELSSWACETTNKLQHVQYPETAADLHAPPLSRIPPSEPPKDSTNDFLSVGLLSGRIPDTRDSRLDSPKYGFPSSNARYDRAHEVSCQGSVDGATPPASVTRQREEPAGYKSARYRREEQTDNASISSAGPITSETLERRRRNMQPGNGMYLPPTMLEEWRKATVGTLDGETLDLYQEVGHDPDADKPWWAKPPRQRSGTGSTTSRAKRGEAFEGEYDDVNVPSRFKPHLYLKCGPLLRFCGIRSDSGSARGGRSAGGPVQKREIWRGTVMIVTRDRDSSYDISPTLRLFAQPIDLLPPPPVEVAGALPPEYVDPLVGHTKVGRRGETLYVRPVEHVAEGQDLSRDETDDGLYELNRSSDTAQGSAEPRGSFASRRKRIEVDGEKLGKFTEVRSFRLHTERGYTFWRFNIEVELRDKQQRIAYRINRGPAAAFWVPAKDQSMNIMFYSGNGFSLTTNSHTFSGPDPMWRDVLNTHQSEPFHAMVGGGNQIYNDAVQVQTELFNEWLAINDPALKIHVPFSTDMQDELEEFYLERYCLWFSQGLFSLANSQIPMVNMLDDRDIIDGYGSYPHQVMSSPVFSGLGNVAFKYYMLFQHQSVMEENETTEPSWILGVAPGPYIHSHSRSLLMMMGARTALLAVDCRTERTSQEVVTKATWEKIMDRCYSELVGGKATHILVVLGVPIAYPRMVTLENVLNSRLLQPVKTLGKAGMFGNFLSRLDQGAEFVDNLDDHWTSRSHKPERTLLVQDLQDLAADKSIRVTILSGHVQLGAVGRFYSNPKLGLVKHKDFRYMPNVVSSAIANNPPPDLVADTLNKRNKLHHLDKDTVEDMIPMFPHGIDGKARNNKHLLPHRNWCAIREYIPGRTPRGTPEPDSDVTPTGTPPSIARSFSSNTLFGRGSKRGRDASLRGPPITNSGLFRQMSRRATASEQFVDLQGETPSTGEVGSQRPTTGRRRTLSLTRGDFGRNIFKRRRKPEDDGDTEGVWDDEHGPDHELADAASPTYVVNPRVAPIRRSLSMRGGGRSTPSDDGRVAGHRFNDNNDSYFTAQNPELAQPLPLKLARSGYYAVQTPDTVGSSMLGARAGGRVATMPVGYHDNNSQPIYTGGQLRTLQQAQHAPMASEQLPTPPSTRHSDKAPSSALRSGPPSRYAERAPGGANESPRPTAVFRTATGLSAKNIKQLGGPEKAQVNLAGGLEITLNFEINQRDPSGSTESYQLLVPRLWYEYMGNESVSSLDDDDGDEPANPSGNASGGGATRVSCPPNTASTRPLVMAKRPRSNSFKKMIGDFKRRASFGAAKPKNVGQAAADDTMTDDNGEAIEDDDGLDDDPLQLGRQGHRYDQPSYGRGTGAYPTRH